MKLNREFISRLLVLFAAIQWEIVNAQAPVLDPVCPAGITEVGEDPTLPVLPVQTNANHGFSTTTVLLAPLFQVHCCGVVESWDLQVYSSPPDGCTTGSCNVDFMVFDKVDTSTKQARLVGVNANQRVSSAHQNGIYWRVSIPVADQIPVHSGNVFGWSAFTNAVQYVEDSVNGMPLCVSKGYTCTQDYMLTSPNDQIQSQTIGKTYPFQYVGSIDNRTITRYYAFRANIIRGTPPNFNNLPATKQIQATDPVGTIPHTVVAKPASQKQTVSYSIVRTCPIGNYWAVNSSTGDVQLVSSLNAPPYLNHTITIAATDGCNVVTRDLTVQVQEPPTTTTVTTITTTTPIPSTAVAATTTASSSTNNNNILSTLDGRVLVGLLGTALGITLLTALASCCLCGLLLLGGGRSRRAFTEGGYAQPYDPYGEANYVQSAPFQKEYPQPQRVLYQNNSIRAQPKVYLKPRTLAAKQTMNEARPPSYNLDLRKS